MVSVETRALTPATPPFLPPPGPPPVFFGEKKKQNRAPRPFFPPKKFFPKGENPPPDLSGNQNRKTITDANGNYRFDNVETNGFYTVAPSSANFSFSPAERSFSQLGNSTEATFTATSGGRIC